MMSILQVIVVAASAVIALILILPAVSDVVSAFQRRRPGPSSTRGETPRFLVLVPAHNEEMLIASCVDSLRKLRYPSDAHDVVVIADNCSDATARVVRGRGVECLERVDPIRRGKPRALEWAIHRTKLADYDMVVVIDADTVVDPDFLSAVAAHAPLRDIAVQGYHDVWNSDDNALTRLAKVFAAARYEHAFDLKERTGLNVPLMGNGMCVGAGILERYGWTAFSICEDWELYAQLTVLGVEVHGAPGARVYSQEAKTLQQSRSQRQRWAAGKMTVLREQLAPLVRSPNISARQKLDVVAELIAPGPVVHLGVVACLVALLAMVGGPGWAWVSLALLLSLGPICLYSLLAIADQPQPLRLAATLAYLPVYAVWRLGVQFSSLGMLGDRPWLKTQRHQSSQG